MSDSLWPPWTVSHQVPLPMEFSRQEYWSELPFPPPGDLQDPGMEPMPFASPALTGRFFTTAPCGKGKYDILRILKYLLWRHGATSFVQVTFMTFIACVVFFRWILYISGSFCSWENCSFFAVINGIHNLKQSVVFFQQNGFIWGWRRTTFGTQLWRATGKPGEARERGLSWRRSGKFMGGNWELQVQWFLIGWVVRCLIGWAIARRGEIFLSAAGGTKVVSAPAGAARGVS